MARTSGLYWSDRKITESLMNTVAGQHRSTRGATKGKLIPNARTTDWSHANAANDYDPSPADLPRPVGPLAHHTANGEDARPTNTGFITSDAEPIDRMRVLCDAYIERHPGTTYRQAHEIITARRTKPSARRSRRGQGRHLTDEQRNIARVQAIIARASA